MEGRDCCGHILGERGGGWTGHKKEFLEGLPTVYFLAGAGCKGIHLKTIL